MKKRIVLILLILLLPLVAEEYPLFPMFMQSGSVPQIAFNGGGSTVPTSFSGASLNPALLYAYHKVYGKKLGFGSSYQRQKSAEYSIGGGGSYAIDATNVIAVDYLYHNTSEGKAPVINRGTISYSALGRQDDNSSFLSWGTNLNYYHNKGMYPAEEFLAITMGDTAWSYSTTMLDTIDGYTQAITADLGFYDLDGVKGVSFSTVLENIIGYQWSERSDGLETISRDTIIGDDTITIDSTFYNGQSVKTNDWLKGHYKSLLIGVALNRRLAGNMVILTLPLDLRFWGFMDKDLRKSSEWKHRTMMRLSADVNINGKLGLRVGYSWAPEEYRTLNNGKVSFHNTHQISGGFRVTLQPVDFEMSFKKDYLAVGVALYL